MFRTDLLSIIRSLNTVFTAIGFCHTGYVHSNSSKPNKQNKHINIKTPNENYIRQTQRYSITKYAEDSQHNQYDK